MTNFLGLLSRRRDEAAIVVSALPGQGSQGREAADGGALHGFGDLEVHEVAEALAVLEAEWGTGEFGEGDVDGGGGVRVRFRRSTGRPSPLDHVRGRLQPSATGQGSRSGPAVSAGRADGRGVRGGDQFGRWAGVGS